MAFIDYMTVSLSAYNGRQVLSTSDVLQEFAVILPDLYKRTCKEMMSSGESTMRVSQYGISACMQYGTARRHGWVYSVQLSGEYWHAIERNHAAVRGILERFADWRLSRLDLAYDVCVPLEDWQKYYKAAFEAGEYTINGNYDARTVYYGSRKSQFFTRIYNKTAADPKHYPAPDGFVVVRYEIEIHRVRGDLVLNSAFEPEFTDRLFLQRVQRSVSNDSSVFIEKYFSATQTGEKIKTVKRVLGNFENTVNYVFEAYAPYISAVMNSELVDDRYSGIEVLNEKGKKVLAILDNGLEE